MPGPGSGRSGGSPALLADDVLPPAVAVATAVEGRRSIPAVDRILGAGQEKDIPRRSLADGGCLLYRELFLLSGV